MTALLVALFGSLGAMARFVVDGELRERLGSRFPWATFVVNVTGSFVLGALGGLTTGGDLPPSALIVAGTGFCGGYTTFSTAAVETVTLLRVRRPVAALAYAAGSLIAAVLAVVLGLALTL